LENELSILNGDQRRQGGNVGVVVNVWDFPGPESAHAFRRDIPWACALTAGIIIGRRASSPDHHLDVEGTHPFFDVSVGNSFGHVRLPRAVELTEALLPVAVAVTDGRQDYSIPGARVLPDVIARRAGVVGLVAYSAVKKLLHVKRSTTQAVCPHFLASLARSLIGRGHFRARGGFERARKVDHAEMIHLGSSEGPEDDLVRAVVDEIDLYGHLFIDFHGIALLKRFVCAETWNFCVVVLQTPGSAAFSREILQRIRYTITGFGTSCLRSLGENVQGGGQNEDLHV